MLCIVDALPPPQPRALAHAQTNSIVDADMLGGGAGGGSRVEKVSNVD
jgi:hypothetical protein